MASRVLWKALLHIYGRFSGVNSYLVMAGKKTDDLDEKVGYYGEQIVLLAQTLGLNTCWVGVSYSKIPNTYVLEEDEKIACYISLGYGANQGVSHKIKSVKEVSNASEATPKWFLDGVNAALLAPTAVNQQKFFFEYTTGNKVIAKRGVSLVGYTQMDLGIVKYHFEVGAGKENFEWSVICVGECSVLLLVFNSISSNYSAANTQKSTFAANLFHTIVIITISAVFVEITSQKAILSNKKVLFRVIL